MQISDNIRCLFPACAAPGNSASIVFSGMLHICLSLYDMQSCGIAAVIRCSVSLRFLV